MAKIIEVTNEIVSIGRDDGTITEVRPSDLNFAPEIGDEVQVFESETKTIVSKVQNKTQTTEPAANSGININVQNTQTNAVPNMYIANGKKAVNKVVYLILAFFLGGIGIHKFYAGKIGSGILYLAFCWTAIPALIAFIEFIVAIFQKPDPNGMILV